MSESNANGRILWSIDPFAGDGELQQSAARAIKALVRDRGVDIEPVYVTSEAALSTPDGFATQEVRRIENAAQMELDRWTARTGLTGILPVRVLQATRPSIRAQIRELLAYAERVKAGLIVASTHARKGPSRWILGSFAETLGLACPLPLLIVNPSWNPSWHAEGGFEQILFPTDFSELSQQAFRQFFPQARAMGRQIMLYHKYMPQGVINAELPSSSFAVPRDVQEDEIRMRKKLAENWVTEARAAGVRADWLVDPGPANSVAEAILEQSRKSGGVIAIAAQSNAIEAILLGSVTRQIIRQSPVPVWVFHTEFPLQTVDSRVKNPSSQNGYAGW